MRRERPRLPIAEAAPRPASGVAHAQRVSVGDVLGARVCGALKSREGSTRYRPRI